MARHWTEKALNRAGYSVTDNIEELQIEIIIKAEGKRWILENNDIIKEFSSLYDLINWLSLLQK